MAQQSNSEGQRVLLPDHLAPARYHLHLTPALEASTFTGHVTIELSVKKTSSKNSVTLHSIGLTIEQSQVRLKRFAEDGTTVASEYSADKINTNEEEETVEFEFGGEAFKVGEKLAISVPYSGPIDDSCAGIYHSNYVVDGVTKFVYTNSILLTHLSLIDAPNGQFSLAAHFFAFCR